MKPPYDTSVRDAIRQRMTPPNRKSVTEITRETGTATHTLTTGAVSGRRKASRCPPPAAARAGSAAAKVAVVIQAGGFMLQLALEGSRAGREQLKGIIEVALHGDTRLMVQRPDASSAAPIPQGPQ